MIQRNVCSEKKSGGGYVWKKFLLTQSEPLTNNSDPQKKSVCQLEYNGILVAAYESISEATHEARININAIRCALKGQQEQAEGYIWT